MNDPLNLLIIVGIISAILFYFFIKLTQAKKEMSLALREKQATIKDEYKIPKLVDYISSKMLELTTSNLYAENLTEEEYRRRLSRRKELKKALRECNTGDESARTFVKEFINDLLITDLKLNNETVNYAIPFDNHNLMTLEEKFETVLYLSELEHGKNALVALIEKFKLDSPKADGGYRVLVKEINSIYEELVKNRELSFEDKLRIVTQFVYAQYKGFGVIDSIREMNIDGVSGGVSGMPENAAPDTFTDNSFYDHVMDGKNTSLESVWIMYKGISIHLSFLSFKSQAELKRVVTNVYKYGYPGQLSETKPAIINEMADGSRVTVVRDKLSESWAFFIRKKYDVSKVALPELIVHKNADILIQLLDLLMKGKQSVAITGATGTGKTTFLTAIIGHLAPYLNLRVLETKFELNLRKRYPHLNILTLQETETVTGQDALDLSKKMDGDVTVLGEVATNPVASWMVQTGQVASLMTLFTHHAKTLTELVHSLRNALLAENLFTSEKIAEQQVVRVLGFDVHWEFNEETGERYIERVSECVAAFNISEVDYKSEFDALKTPEELDAFHKKMEAMYYMQQVQSTQFIENVIIRFENGQYIPVNPISKVRMDTMMKSLNSQEQEELQYLMNEVWGA